MTIIRFFLPDPFDESQKFIILRKLQQLNKGIIEIKTEKCYHIEFESKLSESQHPQTEQILYWLLKSPQAKLDTLKRASTLPEENDLNLIIEIGPRFNFSTPSSTHSVSICHNVGLSHIKRLEISNKYLIIFNDRSLKNDIKFRENVLDQLGDRMTQCLYTKENLPINSFDEQLPTKKDQWYTVPILTEGKRALENVNKNLNLSFDDWDLEFYMNLFTNILKRNPTSVELFDCAQSNSEHSRHWFFKGKLIIDDVEHEQSLISNIIDTQKFSNSNNTIKFSDNSSAIHGFQHKTLQPTNFVGPGPMHIKLVKSNLIFTAETHNMPTAVAPFSGSTTGTGGRIRDVQAVGRGGHTIAGTAGYCVGNLNIPDYNLSYEKLLKYPLSFANPLKIIIEASNGASDYGNKYGEPVITGFAISYGIIDHNYNRLEYVKPIMFSGGIGTMDATHTDKLKPIQGNLLVKIGGPVYRIGVGGGAASSVEIQGNNQSDFDFNAVQRGDAQMENKMNRIVRTCIEMGDKNPILAIHDQGAGGNGNVLKELVEPGYAGAVIFSKEFQLGDPTITTLELWGAEYQENNAILCKPSDRKLLEAICERERCPISFVGVVSGNGYVTLLESVADLEKYLNHDECKNLSVPFDMHLKDVLGDMPRKVYKLNRCKDEIPPLKIPDLFNKNINYNEYLMKVLSIMSVGSKRFLTNKVDRCVTGLIGQQQCVGPLHTPLSDYAITAISHFGVEGIATSIGTQPIKGLINAEAGARMSVAEALTNLVFVKISNINDVKCSGNWMWPAKLPGEGAKMYDACSAMCQIMNKLGIAVDGGKDSLSMAAKCDNETIKSPGTLVISTYAPCPNIYDKITPDLKSPARGCVGEIIWINIEGKFRIGGSAFAQSMGQQGSDCPDLVNISILKNAFNITQNLIVEGKLLSGHDISDGGLIVCLLEMAFAGLCGLTINLSSAIDSLTNMAFNSNGLNKDFAAFLTLFSEECGWILEVSTENLNYVLKEFHKNNIPAYHIGNANGYGLQQSQIQIMDNLNVYIQGKTLEFFKKWEQTSFELEKLQMNRECAIEEYSTYEYRTGPKYHCTFDADDKLNLRSLISSPICVAVIREEGSNGDREMISSLIAANFEVHDVTMSDLITRKTCLDRYRGVIFPGGFSYADTLGSAKGWAASIMYSESLGPQFMNFKIRKDTFSLGVCNGCQLMSLIGWVGCSEQNNSIIDIPDVALLHNKSERYECRWVNLKVSRNKSIMLRKMIGSTVGCWVAHGEGRFSFKNNEIYKTLVENQCIALSYVDDNGLPTNVYPMNPNGSIDGLAGICSLDGRHLAVMPHPERCSQMWQWPYIPFDFKYKMSPWQSMFDEAFIWCTETLNK